jgi:hypothetical protein
MMNGKKPTREDRKMFKRWNLCINNWFICKRAPGVTVVQHRHTGVLKEIPEGYDKRNY